MNTEQRKHLHEIHFKRTYRLTILGDYEGYKNWKILYPIFRKNKYLLGVLRLLHTKSPAAMSYKETRLKSKMLCKNDRIHEEKLFLQLGFVKNIVNFVGCSERTAKTIISKLAKVGILELHRNLLGKGKHLFSYGSLEPRILPMCKLPKEEQIELKSIGITGGRKYKAMKFFLNKITVTELANSY